MKDAKGAQERVQTLVAENSDLQKKLAEAEKTVREISDDKPKKEQEIADVKRQVEQLRQQLASSQKQNHEFEVTIGELRTQLEETSGELAKAKLTGASAEETVRLTKENEMLRAIVMRERQEEARREGAKKLMLAEFEKLQIKSDTSQRADRIARPAGGEIDSGRTGAFEATGGGHLRQQSGWPASVAKFCGSTYEPEKREGADPGRKLRARTWKPLSNRECRRS